MINQQTGEVMRYLKSDIPYLAYNQNADKEIRALNDFLQKKAFQAPITAADLDGLQFDYIDRDDVIALFNQMITSENLPEGKYGYLPEASIEQEDSLLSGYRWQVGQFGCLGNIQQIDIELLYEDDVHLSDLVKDGKATNELHDRMPWNHKSLWSKARSEGFFLPFPGTRLCPALWGKRLWEDDAAQYSLRYRPVRPGRNPLLWRSIYRTGRMGSGEGPDRLYHAGRLFGGLPHRAGKSATLFNGRCSDTAHA